MLLFFRRVFTGSILLLLFIYCLFGFSSVFFELVSFIVLILALYEWTLLIGIKTYFYKVIYIFALFMIIFLIINFYIDLYLLLILNFILWFIGLFFIYLYSRYKVIYFEKVFGILLGIIIFIPWWLAINYLNIVSSYSKLDIIFVSFLVFFADIFAYIFGRKWGYRKLLYVISPGKTWMGVFGGVISTIFLILIFYIVLNIQFYDVYIYYSFVILFLSIIGDLLESMFKRKMNLKDSGILLPGHGGVLDRLDSFLVAIPVFVLLFKC